MTALVCIDTESRMIRRYVPHVNAGLRRAWCTHSFEIQPPQTDDLPREINMIISRKLPGMERPTHENILPAAA